MWLPSSLLLAHKNSSVTVLLSNGKKWLHFPPFSWYIKTCGLSLCLIERDSLPPPFLRHIKTRATVPMSIGKKWMPFSLLWHIKTRGIIPLSNRKKWLHFPSFSWHIKLVGLSLCLIETDSLPPTFSFRPSWQMC